MRCFITGTAYQAHGAFSLSLLLREFSILS